MIETKSVLVGAPDIALATGFACRAETTVTMPESASAELQASDWSDCGDVSEDGIAIVTSYGSTPVKNWNLSTIRTLLDSFEGSVEATFVTTNEATLKTVLGDDYVDVVEATEDHGAQIKARLGAYLAKMMAYCFSMKDGDTRIRVLLPNAQAVPNGNIELKKGGILTWPVVFNASADDNGDSIIIMLDDGQKVTA